MRYPAVERRVNVVAGLFEADADGGVVRSGTGGVGSERRAGLIHGTTGRQGGGGGQRHTGPANSLRGEQEIVAGGQRDVAQPPAPFVHPARLTVSLYDRQE